MGERDLERMHRICAAIICSLVLAVGLIVSLTSLDMTWTEALTRVVLAPAIVACLVGGIVYEALRRSGPGKGDSDER